MSKYIIFCAGNYGRRALKYYNAGNVECFVDNDVSKIGMEVLGKKVISFDELKEIYRGYTIIVATAHSEEIKIQLESAGIFNYICYTPAYEHFIEYMKRKLCFSNIDNIALYGVDNDTSQIIEALSTLGLDNKIKCVIRSRFDKNEIKLTGYDIESDLMKCKQKIDCFIVTSSTNNIALGAELKQLFRESIVVNPYKQSAYYDTDEIVFNTYISQIGEKTEDEWNTALEGDLSRVAVREYVDVVKKNVPLFEFVEIETINQCNGTCTFCPVNKLVDPRIPLKMNEALFKKIIDELSDLNYSGEISLFSNNEPLMDDRVVKFHKYAREKLPNARLHMFTNGTLFTLPLFIELVQYLDELIIDNYQQELKLIKPVQIIKDYVEKNPELRNKVTIALRKRDEILTSRGGDAPNRQEKLSFKGETCALPFEQMIIRPDGKVSLCCNDPIGKVTLGDVSKQSLVDVWYGEDYSKVRDMIVKGRENIEHCRYCDTFYLY